MAKNNTALVAVLGLTLVGAGGAAYYLSQQKKDKKTLPPKDPKKELPQSKQCPPGWVWQPYPGGGGQCVKRTTKDPTKDPKTKLPKTDPKTDPKIPGNNPTIGNPFRPGRRYEQRNAVLSVSRNPSAHPNGRRRGANRETWATDVAFYETYPRGPLQINPKDAKQSGYVSAWKRMRGYVREALAKKKNLPKTTTPKTTTPKTTTPKTKLPKKKDPKTTGHPVFGAPYQAGNEKKNAVVAVSRKPTRHPIGKRKSGKQAWEMWLTNVAYWETHPNGPVQINPKFASHKPFMKSWLRTRSFVRSSIAAAKSGTKKTLPADPKTGDRMVAATKVPDRGLEAANSNWVTKAKPKTWTTPSPYDRWRGASEKQKFVDWLTNVAYWGTYPDAPVRLQKKSPKKWINAWVRINRLVKKLAANRGVTTPSTPPPKIPPTQKIPKADPAPGEPAVGIATNKADLNSAAEVRNAAISVVKNHAKHRAKKDIKLTDEVFRQTYPEAPKKLDSKNGGHKKYIDAWVRIRQHVKRGLALRPKLKSDPLGQSDANWRTWALAMAATSPLRSRVKLARTYAKAAKHYSTKTGSTVAKRDIGSKAGPHDVTLSGLLAEAAIRIPSGKLTEVTKWRGNPARAFWAANGLF
jgi:hypothetical protein